MHVPNGCHIFQICHKNRTACMRLVGDAPECMFLVEGRHTIAYIFLCHFVYISMPTSRYFQQLLCWISIYAHNCVFLRSNMEMRPPVNRMPDFYACTALHKYLHLAPRCGAHILMMYCLRCPRARRAPGSYTATPSVQD